MRNHTADAIGVHPFAVRVVFGDDRRPAYVQGPDGTVTGPGVQVFTHAAEEALAGRHGVTRGELMAATRSLNIGVPFLINVASQQDPDRYARRLADLAAAAGVAPIPPPALRVLEKLKQSVDAAQALGPQAIARAAMTHLADAATPGGAAYGVLVSYVNRALANTAGNPRRAAAGAPAAGISDIGAEGVELWWVKEGSATIVFQVRVHLTGGRPPARFALNVPKDITAAAAELRQTHAEFTELYAMDPRHVMEPFGLGEVAVRTWRGTATVPLLAAEWFDGHELHVYPQGPRLHVWQDQHMGHEHPLPPEASDDVWEHMIRVCARYTRVTPGGLVPLGAHINAGDFIFRQRPGGWDVLLIWCRRPAAGSLPDEFVVVNGLLAATTAFGPERDVVVFWDQPERALRAVCSGLAEAGLAPARITALLRQALDGPFMRHADHPEEIPWLTRLAGNDPARLGAVFSRARQALVRHLDPGA